MVRAYDEAFASTDTLDELLYTLARACAPAKSTATTHAPAPPSSDLLPPISNACSALLTELLAKYHHLPLCKRWVDENPALVPAQARVHAQSHHAPQQQPSSNNLLPHTIAQIRTAVVAATSGPIPDSIESILRSSFSLDKLVAASVQLFSAAKQQQEEDAVTGGHGVEGRGPHPLTFARHVVSLLSLAEPTSAKLGVALKHSLSTCIQSMPFFLSPCTFVLFILLLPYGMY